MCGRRSRDYSSPVALLAASTTMQPRCMLSASFANAPSRQARLSKRPFIPSVRKVASRASIPRHGGRRPAIHVWTALRVQGFFVSGHGVGYECDHVSGLEVRHGDRGPDGFRERALNTSAVSQRAGGWHGVSRSSVRPIAIFCCCPFTLGDERLRQPPAVAGMARRSSSWPTRHGPSCWPEPLPRPSSAIAAAGPAAMHCRNGGLAWPA